MPNAKGYWNYLVLGFFGTSLGGFHPRVGARCYLPKSTPSFWVIGWVKIFISVSLVLQKVKRQVSAANSVLQEAS